MTPWIRLLLQISHPHLAIRLEEEIGGLKDLDQIDPRFITCFTVKLKP